MSAIAGIAAEAWVQHLGWTLVQFLWQGTLISLLFAAVRALVGQRVSAHARYILACATLGLMVTVPGLTFLLRISVPLVPAWPVPSPGIWRTVLPWLVAAWLGGVAVCSTRLIAGWGVTARLRSVGVRPAQPEWQRRLEDLVDRLGVSRPVRLLVSSLVDVPVVVGWWRPVILMPMGALTGLPPAHVEALLAHELAHVRRLDYLVNILQSLAEAALFYHPAVWWVSDQIRAERELCCDDIAVSASGDVLTYAHALTELESRRPVHVHALAASGGSLLDRIRRLLGQATPVSHALPGPGVAGMMSLLCLLGIGAVATHAAPAVVPPSPAGPSIEAPVTQSPHPILSALFFGPVGPAVALPQRPRISLALSALLFATPTAPAQVAGGGRAASPPSGGAAAGVTGAGTGTGAISGVVSDAATGRPIAGAIASLRIYGPPGPLTGQQVTDARGRFVFDELVASKQYILDVSKPGYVDGHYGQIPSQPLSGRFALADEQWLSTANVELSKVGAIGGVVTDEFGEPVVGAFVRALAEITVGGRRQLAAGSTAKTDDRGEYRLTGLLAARYIVMLPSVQSSVPASTTPAQIEGLGEDMYARLEAALARDPATPHINNGAVGDGGTRLIIGNFATPPAPAGGHDRAYPITFFPGTTSIAGATTIDLSDGGEKSGVDLTMQPVAAVRVTGRVEGMTTPARLTLRLVPAGLEALGAGSEAATTIVNADGTFTFLSVPAGTYTLDTRQSMFEFLASGVYVPYTPTLPRTPGRELLGGQTMGAVAGASSGTGYSLSYAPGPDYVGRVPLTVGSADVSNVVVTMQPAATIRGRFVYEDLPGPPPQRANIVFAEPAGGNWGLGLAASVNWGPDDDPATFSIRLGPGAFKLRPTPPLGTVVKSIVIDGQDHLKTPIEVSAGHDLDAVVTFTGKVPVLSGAVRTAQGVAAEHAIVIAYSTDRATWPDLGLAPTIAKIVGTSPQGTFTLSTLPAGDYYVVAVDASRTDSWTDPAFLAKVAPLATRVSIEWGGSKSVDLKLVTVK